MENITGNFGTLYYPVSSLVIYKSRTNKEIYVEHFDMDKSGCPINAHPLTIREATILAKALNIKSEIKKTFLKTSGILPVNVLHINSEGSGSVLWYTKASRVKMFFTQHLEIPNGIAEVPAILWYASKSSLAVFALASNKRPTKNTQLYHAPFLNLYKNGNVCMGTVDVNIKSSASVEEFIAAWENYFFNSYFSHLINNHNPVKGNIVNLWKELINTGIPFPKEVLVKTDITIKNLLQ